MASKLESTRYYQDKFLSGRNLMPISRSGEVSKSELKFGVPKVPKIMDFNFSSL